MLDPLITDLRLLIADLGTAGGAISPAVYDTAQLLRFCPPPAGSGPALDWLQMQQQVDGGWGPAAVPLTRTVPTLAAVLALHAHATEPAMRTAVARGLAFLRHHADQWREFQIDALPVAAELILPQLLDCAERAGLHIPREPYTALEALGRERRQRLVRLPPAAATPASHAWEAWGGAADARFIDARGSVGHSPAATAAWLCKARASTHLTGSIAAARRYLDLASAATGVSIAGVVPCVWPLDGFEHGYGLYSLLAAGLLDHPALRDIVAAALRAHAGRLRPHGYGHSHLFMPDGDDTAVGLAVLRAAGHPVDLGPLHRYATEDYFATYLGELNPSLVCTAHAVVALRLAGEDATRSQRFLHEHQLASGQWPADKWHSSWIYTTFEVIQALLPSADCHVLAQAAQALLVHQHPDGGWGTQGASTTTETAYAILALHALHLSRRLPGNYSDPLRRAGCWLLRAYRPCREHPYQGWIGKELYRPHRVDQAFELSALLTFLLAEDCDAD